MYSWQCARLATRATAPPTPTGVTPGVAYLVRRSQGDSNLPSLRFYFHTLVSVPNVIFDFVNLFFHSVSAGSREGF